MTTLHNFNKLVCPLLSCSCDGQAALHSARRGHASQSRAQSAAERRMLQTRAQTRATFIHFLLILFCYGLLRAVFVGAVTMW
jgi:hypothetical protein